MALDHIPLVNDACGKRSSIECIYIVNALPVPEIMEIEFLNLDSDKKNYYFLMIARAICVLNKLTAHAHTRNFHLKCSLKCSPKPHAVWLLFMFVNGAEKSSG